MLLCRGTAYLIRSPRKFQFVEIEEFKLSICNANPCNIPIIFFTKRSAHTKIVPLIPEQFLECTRYILVTGRKIPSQTRWAGMLIRVANENEALRI
jgi:hypothetical protein